MKEKNITVNDIAKYLNISPSTVSRALNNNPKISQKTKEKVWEAAKKLGYTPNLPAYLINSTKQTLLIITNAQDNIFFLLQNQLIQKLKQHNITPLVFLTDSDITSNQIELFHNLNLWGILISLYHPWSEQTIKLLKTLDKPIFTLNTSTQIPAAAKLLIDYYYAGYLAIKHLTATNTRRIALITEPQLAPMPHLDEIKAGINSALLETDADFATINLQNYLTDHIHNFDAVIAATPTSACKVFCHLQHLGIKIPNQVALVSIGTDKCQELLPLPLTHVHFAFNQALERFAQIISQILEGKDIKQEVIVPTRLIIKTSSLKLLKNNA